MILCVLIFSSFFCLVENHTARVLFGQASGLCIESRFQLGQIIRGIDVFEARGILDLDVHDGVASLLQNRSPALIT